VIDPSEIMAARQALGRLLAGYRKAAGLNQYPSAARYPGLPETRAFHDQYCELLEGKP